LALIQEGAKIKNEHGGSLQLNTQPGTMPKFPPHHPGWEGNMPYLLAPAQKFRAVVSGCIQPTSIVWWDFSFKAKEVERIALSRSS
jgi:hypothetical protein